MSVLHAPTYHWTVEEYEKLNGAGIFTESDRVELLNGEIIVMSPIGYRHATAVARLTKFFVRHGRDRYELHPQNPFVLDERSEPHPDIFLVDPKVEALRRHPRPDEIFLVIEVSDSTVRYDREDKRPAYARNGIREYWLLNLEDNVLEVFRDPAGDTYRGTQVLGADALIAPLEFPDVQLRVGDFLP
jgi:Uma2 family endonuclease